MKELRYYEYWDIRNWIPLRELKTPHGTFYSIQCGEVVYCVSTGSGNEINKSPIIKWVHEQELKPLIIQGGAIIF